MKLPIYILRKLTRFTKTAAADSRFHWNGINELTACTPSACLQQTESASLWTLAWAVVALLLLVMLGLAFGFSNWWQRGAFCPGYRFTFHSNIGRYENSAFIAQSKLEWKWYFYFCFWEPLRTNGSAVVLPSSCSWLWSNNLYSAAELHEIRTN